MATKGSGDLHGGRKTLGGAVACQAGADERRGVVEGEVDLDLPLLEIDLLGRSRGITTP
jgi:hypothetical protein